MTTARKAINHVNEVREKYSKEISHSIQNTKIHRDDVQVLIKDKNTVMNIKMVYMDTVSAIQRYADGKTAALNFASYKHPGGGFLKGCMAQEEDLCHKSTLYPVISTQCLYYENNIKNLNSGLYTNAALYSEDIIFETDNKPIVCDVITCAAPNWGAARRNGVSRVDNSKALKDRIEFILKLAASYNVETLILGAWGCGVFRQDSAEVAEMFQNALQKYPYFKIVIFAVPGGNSFEAFKNVFA